ncbi:MAG: WXG100 family type VII secretion target, partial [Caldilineaceae bacterium]|nr:WXG100 family type VII secretion target [Caldilineaceae bacterium]
MAAEAIQAKYDELDQLANRFGNQARAQSDLQQQVRRAVQALQNGGWEGQGAAAFFSEMNGRIFPAQQRLIAALEQARTTTLEIKVILQRADEEAAQPFKGGGGQVASGNSSEQGIVDKTLDFIGDLFGGAGAELGGMLKGLGNLIVHPVDTLKGLWQGVTHPQELWEAFKTPYVEDWSNGHPGRAIGRGLMFAGSLLLGTKGADKALKAVGIGGKGAEIAEIASQAGRTGEVLEGASTAGRVGEVAEVTSSAGKLINNTARAISVQEQAIAELLVNEGRVVEVVAEG